MAENAPTNTQAIPATQTGTSLLDFLKSLKGKPDSKAVGPGATAQTIPSNFIDAIQENTTSLKYVSKLLEPLKTFQDETEKLVNTVLKYVSSNADPKVDLGAQVIPPTQTNSKEDTSKGALQTDKPQDLIIVDIQDKAFDKLQKMFEKINVKIPDKKEKKDTTPEKSNWPGLGTALTALPFVGPMLKSLGEMLTKVLLDPATGYLAGLFIGIDGIFDTGPFKGVKKLVSDFLMQKMGPKFIERAVASLTKFAEKEFIGPILPKAFSIIGGAKGLLETAAKRFAPILLKGVRFIPLIGPLISLGFAISRIIKGDYIGGLIDVASGLVSFIPAVGPTLALGIDLLNAARDFSGGGVENNAKSPANQNITNFLIDAWDTVSDGIADIFNFYLGKVKTGWDLITSGNLPDTLKGLGMWATLIPGIGWVYNITEWLMTPANENVGEDRIGNGPRISLFAVIKKALADKVKALVKSILGLLPDWLSEKVEASLGLEGIETPKADIEIPKPAFKAAKPIDIKKQPKADSTTQNPKEQPKTTPQTSTSDTGSKSYSVSSVSQPEDEYDSSYSIVPQSVKNDISVPSTVASVKVADKNDNVKPKKAYEAEYDAPVDINNPADAGFSQKIMEAIKEGLKPLQGMAMAGAGGGSVTNAAALSNLTGISNSSTVIYSDNTERDVPYVERNKFRSLTMNNRDLY